MTEEGPINLNVRKFAVFISSVLVCFAVHSLRADQQTVLVVAQDSQLFYHRNGHPTGLEEVPKGTELTIERVSDERCFVTYKGKPAYIRREFLVTKQEFLAAQQKANQQRLDSHTDAVPSVVGEKSTTNVAVATTNHNAATKDPARDAAIHSVIQNLKLRADTAIDSGHYHFIGAMFTSYQGEFADETAKEREQLAKEYDEQAQRKEQNQHIAQEQFEADQKAKGLVPYNGAWLTPQQLAASAKRLQDEADRWYVAKNYNEAVVDSNEAFKRLSVALTLLPKNEDSEARSLESHIRTSREDLNVLVNSGQAIIVGGYYYDQSDVGLLKQSYAGVSIGDFHRKDGIEPGRVTFNSGDVQFRDQDTICLHADVGRFGPDTGHVSDAFFDRHDEVTFCVSRNELPSLLQVMAKFWDYKSKYSVEQMGPVEKPMGTFDECQLFFDAYVTGPVVGIELRKHEHDDNTVTHTITLDDQDVKEFQAILQRLPDGDREARKTFLGLKHGTQIEEMRRKRADEILR